MNARKAKPSQIRKMSHLKRPMDPGAIKRRRMKDVAKTSSAPKNGSRNPERFAKKRKLSKTPTGFGAKNPEKIKKRKTVRTKKQPFWVKSVCSLPTLSVPIITRSMSKCFDSWRKGGTKGPRPDVWVGRRPTPGTKYPVGQKRKGGKAGAVSGSYRPVVSRSRKLQLREKIMNYMYRDAAPWREDLPTLGPRARKEDISTQTIEDASSGKTLLASAEEQQVNSSFDRHAVEIFDPYSAHLVSQESCVQVDMASGDKRSTSGKQENAICDRYDLDPELYRVQPSSTWHDPVWVQPDSRQTTGQSTVTGSETSEAGEPRPETSTPRTTETPTELNPEIFKSSGFSYSPRNSNFVHQGFRFPGPIWTDGLPTSSGSRAVVSGSVPRSRLLTPAVKSPSEHATSPGNNTMSHIYHPCIEKSRKLDRSKRRSKLGMYSYQCLSPKDIKVLDLNHRKSRKDRKSRKPRASSPGSCLCCAESMKHVCRCCLKIRSQLRPKTTRRALPDAPKTRREPKRVDAGRKNGLDASLEAAQHVYRKLKEIIWYYGCSDGAQ